MSHFLRHWQALAIAGCCGLAACSAPPPPARTLSDRFPPPPGRLRSQDRRFQESWERALESGSVHPIIKIAPVYPERARAMRLDGSAVVRIFVDEMGRVTDTQVLESSDPMFESSSVDAACKFVFAPKIVDGVAVARTYDNVFRYRMENDEARDAGTPTP
ncbi:MAG: energy transducer TonB [bacterium]